MTSEEFKRYFKFPLIYRDGFVYVLDNDGRPVLTWLVIQSESPEDPQEIINKMNGYSTKKYENTWNIRDNVFIYYGDRKMFLVRGCNLLMDSKTLSLPHDKALKLQANFAKHLINNLNK